MPAERLPPAQPAYVLRGHSSQVHALSFAHANSRLITGDADGWVVCWSLAHRRPTAVWKAHESTILGLAVWGTDRVVTHGRDNKLIAWKLGIADEPSLDTILPVDGPHRVGENPNVIHTLIVNTLNFCSFAWCRDECVNHANHVKNDAVDVATPATASTRILIAVPHTLDSDGVDIYNLPSEARISTIPAQTAVKTGMVMALDIHFTDTKLRVIAGYESGHTTLFALDCIENNWQKLYSAQPHSQPVLSLSASPTQDYYLTSSADAIIAKHPIPSTSPSVNPDSKTSKLLLTQHSGQQGLSIRSDGKIFSTAGWDSRIRVYSVKTMKELAVLKWHKDGCFATAFADIGNLSLANAKGPETESSISIEESQKLVLAQGQSKPITDLAALANPATTNVSQRRDIKAQTTHWLAAGSKDGKVSLWDIY